MAEAHVADRVRALNTARTAETCARLRPDADSDPMLAAAKQALRSVTRHQALTGGDQTPRRRAAPPVAKACRVA